MNQRKRLGTAFENRLVEEAKKAGFTKSRRQPLSGVLREFPSDAIIEDDTTKILAECKVRAVEIDAAGEKTFRLEFQWVDKVEEQAQRDRSFDFGVVVLQPKGHRRRYAVMSLDSLFQLAKRR
jgi:Holliday junction resolvase